MLEEATCEISSGSMSPDVGDTWHQGLPMSPQNKEITKMRLNFKMRTMRIGITKDWCRSTALYSSSPRNRRTSSSVCKAGALVSPSSCLDGEPHGCVPVDTHSTPVPSMTGEAVGGLCNVRAQLTTGRCATRTW